jgi:hypothetical protein
MKNTIAVLTVVGLMVVALPTSAAVGFNLDTDAKAGVKTRLLDRAQVDADFEARGEFKSRMHNNMHKFMGRRDHRPFMVMGQVKTVSADQLVIEVVNGMRGQADVGEEIVVKIDSETRIVMNGEELSGDELSALVGQNVLIKARYTKDGEGELETEPAQMVIVTGQKQRVFGEITAVSDESITVKNSRTGESQIIELNSDTKIKINGENSEAGDIQEGDKVMVKIKATVDSWIAKAISIFR